MQIRPAPLPVRPLFAATLALLLAACGGGGGGGNTPAPPTTGALRIAGTVATSVPQGGTAVDIRCRVGSGNTTTGTNGSYSVDFTAAALPCVVTATVGGQALHAVASVNNAGTGTANVTPLSEWLLVRISGGDVANYVANIASDAQAAATTTALASALPILREGLVDVTTLTGVDPMSDVWTPAIATNVAQVVQAMTTATTTTAAVADSFAVKGQPLPPAGDVKIQVSLALAPRAASCAGLRTGTYRLLDPNVATIAAATPLVTINATALTGQWQDGRASPNFTLTNNATCDYTTNPGGTRLIVGTKGTFAMAQSTVGANKFSAMLIREQPVPLASLASEWNLLNYVKAVGSATYATHSETFALDANGNFSNVQDCTTLTACTGAGAGSLVAAASGGYVRAAGVGATTRIFAVKSADGQVALVQVGIEANGERRFGIATRKVTEALPVLGSTWLANEFLFTSSGASQLPAAPRYNVLATNSDPQNLFYLRQNVASPSDQQAFQLNVPRAGLRLRAPNPNTGLPALLYLQLPALDGIIWGDPNNAPGFFGVSVLGP